MPKNIVGEQFCVPETFWYEKFLDSRSITIFLIFFCLTSPKITVGEHVCVSELFWFYNFLDDRGITILSIVFVSQFRKICGAASNDSKKLGHPKKIMILGEFHDCSGELLVSQYRKNWWGNAFVFQKSSSTEKVYG